MYFYNDSEWSRTFRGRNANYPETLPAQLRICDFPASGSSVVLAVSRMPRPDDYARTKDSIRAALLKKVWEVDALKCPKYGISNEYQLTMTFTMRGCWQYHQFRRRNRGKPGHKFYIKNGSWYCENPVSWCANGSSET